jgi:hypothetical protein
MYEVGNVVSPHDQYPIYYTSSLVLKPMCPPSSRHVLECRRKGLNSSHSDDELIDRARQNISTPEDQ